MKKMKKNMLGDSDTKQNVSNLLDKNQIEDAAEIKEGNDMEEYGDGNLVLDLNVFESFTCGEGKRSYIDTEVNLRTFSRKSNCRY